MGPRDWFSVGVRLLGVYVFYRAVAQWLGLFAEMFAQVTRSELSRDLGNSESRNGYVVVFGVGYLILSYFFIFGAERLTRLAFNEQSELDSDEAAAEPE
jgi:hypothetical protein